MLTHLFLTIGLLLTSLTLVFAQDVPTTPITLENVNALASIHYLGRGAPTVVQFSPDGQTLAVGSSVGLWLYDMTDLTAPPRRLPMDIQVTSVAFSPAGGLIAVGMGDGVGRIFDRATSQQLDYVVAGPVPERGAMANFNVPVSRVGFTTTQGNGRKNDGSGAVSNLAVTDSDGTALYLDVVIGGGMTRALESRRADGLTAQIIDHTVHVLSAGGESDDLLVGFTPRTAYATMDAEVIAPLMAEDVSLPAFPLMTVSYEGEALVWDVDTGAVVSAGHFDPLPSDAVTARLGTISAHVESFRSILISEGESAPYSLTHEANVTALAFRPDGVFLAAGEYNSTITLWDMVSHAIFTSQYAHFGAVMALTWSPDGSILYSGGEDNRVFAWEITADPDYPLQSLASIGSHAAPVIAVWALSDGARLVSVSQDGTAAVWAVSE